MLIVPYKYGDRAAPRALETHQKAREVTLLRTNFRGTDMTASSMGHNVGKHPTAKEERKLRKPLIERKRRERINNCLDQLKETVIGAFRLDQSKLEKADILEMTVKHLQNIQKSKLSDPLLGLEAQQRYSTGYIQCMHEVHNMLLTCDWMDKNLGSRLLNHLLKSLPLSGDEPHPLAPASASLPPPNSSPRRLPSAPSRVDPSTPPTRAQVQSPHIGGVLEMWRPW